MARIEVSILTGLGMGMAWGLGEAVLALSGVGNHADFSVLPAWGVGIWGLFGLAAGVVAAIHLRPPSTDLEARALSASRVLAVLVLVSVWARTGSPGAETTDWLRLATFVAIGAAAWAVCVAIAKIRATALPLSAITRGRWLLAVSSAGIAATVLAMGGASPTLSVFRPPQATTPPPSTQAPRLLVLGIDAAKWELVMPLIEAGDLPNLRSLMERGTWGTLRSYRRSLSPVVWTSIMTGKTQEQHGLWGVSTQRKVKPVWQIATEAGLRCAVINVPGTYPVRNDCGLMLAGFPQPGRAHLNNEGWLATTGEPAKNDRSALHVPLSVDPGGIRSGDSVRTMLALRDTAISVPDLRPTPLFRMIEALVGGDTAEDLQQACAEVSLGDIELEITREADSGELVVRGAATDELFTLRRGEWSGWLTATVSGSNYNFRIHFTEDDPSQVSLFVTPQYLEPEKAFATPVDLVPTLTSPYVAEAVGWSIFRDPRVLESLRSHLMDTAATRAEAAMAILDRFDLDVFIDVFTVTDRMQHAMMKFLYPQTYLDIAEKHGGEFERLKPLPQQVERLGASVPDAYRKVDQWIGEILSRAGPDTDVVVVSDHGAQPGPHGMVPTAGVHHRLGIYVIAKAPLARETGNANLEENRGELLNLHHITPILLYLLGLPVAEDMPNPVPDALLDADQPMTTVPTYEDGGAKGAQAQSEVDPAIVEQLRSLGYIK